MRQWSDNNLNTYLEALVKNHTHDLSMTLFHVAEIGRIPKPQPMPTGNAKVIGYLEKLVEDYRRCVVDWRIPYAYGELRWLAARLLACEYAFQGISNTIILSDVIQPIRQAEMTKFAEYKKMSLEELLQYGVLPRKTEVIKPQDYADCCSKETVEERKRNQDKNE